MRFHLWMVAAFAATWLCVSARAEDPKLKEAKDALAKRVEQMGEQLRGVKMTHVFADRSFSKALDLVREKCKVPIVIDPVVDPADYTVPVEDVRDMSLKSALQIICSSGLQQSLRGEAIFITTSEAAHNLWRNHFREPAQPTTAQEKLILTSYQFRTDVKFDKTSVKDAVALLAQKSKAKIKLDSADDVKDMAVTMDIKDASLRSLLDLVCGTRLGWMIVDDSILVGLPAKLRKVEEEIKAREEAKRKAEEEKKMAEEAKKEAEEAKKKAEPKAEKQPVSDKKAEPQPTPKKETKKGAENK
ncbi:MAG: hypothetical protein AB1696_24590 [Planctomycetota bacterium]